MESTDDRPTVPVSSYDAVIWDDGALIPSIIPQVPKRSKIYLTLAF